MVACELLRAEFLIAVLAAEFVSEVDVLSGESYFAPAKADVPEEANHGRNLQCVVSGVYTAVALLKNLDFLQKDQLYRPLPVDHIQRFKRCVEQQDLFEGVYSLR